MLAKTLLGDLLIIGGVEGPYTLINNLYGWVVLQSLLQASRPNHNSSDVRVDAEYDHGSLVLKYLCHTFGGHAACFLVIIQDVAQFASRRNWERRTDDYGGKSV